MIDDGSYLHSLEPSSDEMRAIIEQAAERVIDHIVSLPGQPTSQ